MKMKTRFTSALEFNLDHSTLNDFLFDAYQQNRQIILHICQFSSLFLLFFSIFLIALAPKLSPFQSSSPYFKSNLQYRLLQHVNNLNMKKSFLILILVTVCSVTINAGRAPFIDFNELHPTRSQFEFNLILNQNRNTPIILVQYSQNKTQRIIKDVVAHAFNSEPDIAFALFVDCRDFSYDMNHSIAICKGFEEYQKTYVPKDEDDDPNKLDDPFFGFDFFSPNPTRIKQKGHIIAKNHDTQNLRSLNTNFNGDYLAKVIRNQIPDFITYIEDQRDLDDFLQIQSQFRLSKGPKLLYFDQNLQSPLFLKKLGVRLDGWLKIAVSDSPRMVAQFKSRFDSLLLLQYDFQAKKYEAQQVKFNLDDSLQNILSNKIIKSYTDIRKPRDILLDFQHKEALIYNISNVKQINQLISHGRIILLQVSSHDKHYQCPGLKGPQQKYEVLFELACLKRDKAANLLTIMQVDPKKQWQGKLFFIDGSIKNTKILKEDTNLYNQLPQAQARQKITTEKEMEMCISGAKASQKEPILYYFHQKTHSTSLSLLKYFGSLSEVNSLLYFCQFLLPDQDIRKTYQLSQNTIFTLTPSDNRGQFQKVEHKKMQDFFTIKMFLREVSISKMLRVYQERVISNQIKEIKSSQQLTERCFSHKCVIALFETNTFHMESELKILKEMQIDFSDQPFKYYWIDGLCHYQVGRQLKLVPKGSKIIERSHLFLYNEKNNEYALWKGNKLNKFWLKKDVFRWVKSLRNPANIGRVKFGIDLQNRVCPKPETPIQKAEAKPEKKAEKKPEGKHTQYKKKTEVSEDEL